MKRFFDVCFSVFALFILSIPMISLFFLIRIKLGSPVFFYQKRSGINGVEFKMIKFRTMTQAKDESGNLLPDEMRLTNFGLFLRKSSLDELPELWNVIRGDMSIVGPRPLIVEYLPLYSTKQFRRHDVVPGITGWAQVNGRNTISWEQKFEYDLWYIDNQNFYLDLKIIWITIKKIIMREGISTDKNNTTPKFKGSKKRLNK